MGVHFCDQGLGMLLEVLSKVMGFQSDLSHLAHGATFDNETIAFGIEKQRIGGTSFSGTVLHLVLKSPIHSYKRRE
jgi:hypothetical protein